MNMHHRTTTSSDGVAIAYSVSGSADTALVFIHGGLANRSFWDGQHGPFAERFQVIALDLAGHGDSGRDRHDWRIPQFGRDVVAVLEAERPAKAILIGNSLGGSVAIETAVLAPQTAIGVVGVDTLHDLGRVIDPEQARQWADPWRRDFDGALDQMLRALFHPDADPSLVAEVRSRMSRTPAEIVSSLFASFAGYDTGASARRLRIPLRCINGDLFPTPIEAIRKVAPDFDAVVLPHTGHYPMLERPEEFNRKLAEIVEAMTARQ